MSPFVYRPLGTMRFVLALLVMGQHYLQWDFPGKVQRVVMMAQPGSTAVLVFFFLSGFVIVEAADRIYTGRPGSFLINRFLRIVPIFLVAVLLTFFALYAVDHYVPIADESGEKIDSNPFTFKNIAANLLAIVPLPGRLAYEPSVPVLRIAWALRVEVAFYATVAGLLFLGLWKPIAFRIYFGLLGLILLAFYGWYATFKPSWNPLIGFVPYFCAGGAYYFWLQGSRGSLVLLQIALASSLYETAFNQGMISALLYSVLILGSLFLASITSKYNKLDHLLGDLSYPVYVGHWLPLLLFATAFGHDKTIASQLSCLVLGSLLPILYYSTVELWMRQIRNAVRGMSIR